jgi:glycosyltransferase involved in cell wall biosynthesis
MPKTVFIIANWAQGTAFSGGDRIFIEMARYWQTKPDIAPRLLVSEEGATFCRRYRLTDVRQEIWSPARWTRWGMPLNLLLRTLYGLWRAVNLTIPSGETVVYSSSDFWPDALPALFLKLRRPKIRWIAGFYLFAPYPLARNSPYAGRARLRGLLYWLVQRISYAVIYRWSDTVCVTSDPDVAAFISPTRGPSRVVVVQGVVDVTDADAYLVSDGVRSVSARRYDACFVGRLHFQKGVLELIDIWRAVVDARPSARLAIIGTGSLESAMRDKLSRLGLLPNVDVLGFRDGTDKYEIFKDARIMVHPATYDSGGMAAAEGMAWGLPGVSFDLPALVTYYPRGMLKARSGDMQDFARLVLELLDNPEMYEQVSRDARHLISQVWDWKRRAPKVHDALFSA